MKYKIALAFFLIVIICSCKDKVYEVRISKSKLLEGEYFSELSPDDGFSVRNNKIAFFKNMEFGSDDIYEYAIIDSIMVDMAGEENIGTYLKRTDSKDTLYTQIDRKTDSLIILNPKVKPELFKLKRRIMIK